jgi:steroid 5-alpha reductase family enzyme
MTLLPSAPLSLLGLALVICLVVSAVGFRRADWFISLGYGFSIAAQAVAFSLLHVGALDFWLIVQQALLLAYGLRLALFLLTRERNPSYKRERAGQAAFNVPGAAKIGMWVAVALLYVSMFSPGLLSLVAVSNGAALPSLPVGAAIMLAGLGLEAGADAQKSRFKAANPSKYVSTGLFAFVRMPNYLGEMLFWAGVFVSGISAYQTIGDWLLAATGILCIQFVMLGAARTLEKKQAQRYGDDPDFQRYSTSVPVLFPFVPVYSLRK